ncbi:MAG TPA: hypothetical protein VFY96_11465 [Candidatus Binatia bacterium]|nr:hypothetical protein [Candidatus Binatia bacterium]
MVQLVLFSGIVIALTVGVTLFLLVLIRAVRNSTTVTESSQIGPLNADGESPTESHWMLTEDVIRGYDTPELYGEDSIARAGGVTTDKQLR